MRELQRCSMPQRYTKNQFGSANQLYRSSFLAYILIFLFHFVSLLPHTDKYRLFAILVNAGNLPRWQVILAEINKHLVVAAVWGKN